MAQRIRHILVAVGDGPHAPRAELRKAGVLARAAGASVELFHSISEPQSGGSAREFRPAAVRKDRQRLERFARDCLPRGLEVECTSVWDYPPHEAVVRRALTTRADLVIAATRPHRLGARMFLRNTDWELIRHCPIPVLLVKSHRPYRKPAVVTAVDPFHAHARPADLDARLLDMSIRFSELLHGSPHAFHAYMPLISVEPLPGGPLIPLPPEAEEVHGRQIRNVIDRLAARAGIPPAGCHVCMGDLAGELAATVRRTRAGLVVMGAVSRSALARLFIGNAAERVLDKLTCDVLIVKPRGFKSTIPRRRAMAALSSPTPRSHSRLRRRGEQHPPRRAAPVALPPLL
jgi:universal stress protein E